MFIVNADVFGLIDVKCRKNTVALRFSISVLQQSPISTFLIASVYSQAKHVFHQHIKGKV